MEEKKGLIKYEGTSLDTHDRYSFIKQIGKGGFAEVDKVYDEQLKRNVALKCLNKKHADSPEVRFRFENEAFVISQIDHPGVLPIYEFGELNDGSVFYSMKMISGITLDDAIKRHGKDSNIKSPINLRLIRIFERVCEVMKVSHDKGIIHRDLKPANIMIDEADSVYVVDWGLAKDLDFNIHDTVRAKLSDEVFDEGLELTKTGAIKGSPYYLSPEQAEGRTSETDTRSDVFSLGIMLYYIMTGQKPFNAVTFRALVDQITDGVYAPIHEIKHNVPKELQAICHKALENDPDKRYQNAGELLKDIRNYRENKEVSSYKAPFLAQAKKWFIRHPKVTGASIVACLVLFVTSFFIASEVYVNSLSKLGLDAHLDAMHKKEAEIEALTEELKTHQNRHLQLQLERAQELEFYYRSRAKEFLAGRLIRDFMSPSQEDVKLYFDLYLEGIEDMIERGHYHVALISIDAQLKDFKDLEQENLDTPPQRDKRFKQFSLTAEQYEKLMFLRSKVKTQLLNEMKQIPQPQLTSLPSSTENLKQV